MDALTQAALGAACAQACFGRVLGRRAALWGALGALVPDVNVVFAPVAGPTIGYWVWKLHGRHKRAEGAAQPPPPRPARGLPHPGAKAMLGTWMALFVVALLAHPLLDLLTEMWRAAFG